MTPEEEFQFCGDVCMAARKLGVYGVINEKDGLFQMIFWDIMPRTKIEGDEKPTKKEALVSGCEKFVNYLTFKPTT